MSEPYAQEWRDVGIFDLVTIAHGQVDPRLREYRELPLIAPDHLESGSGRLICVETAAEQGAISGKYLVEPGDVIYSKIRPNLRKAHLARFRALCSADMYPLRPKNGVDPEFILSVLLSEAFTAFAVSTSMRSGIPKINRAELAEYELLAPPSQEQRAIGRALKDADDLITSLEAQTSKKRDIKQGMIQELLTGRTRLAGFHVEWRDLRLGDVLSVRHGKSQATVESSGGTYPILATGGQIGWARTPLYSKPSVLIGRKGTIDRPQYQDQPFWTVDTLFYTEIAASADPRYLYYVFSTVDWRSLNEASGVPSLSSSRVESVSVRLPELREQEAIRAVLDDVDAEILSLERRLDAVRAIKTGMMQELLTGRTRLSLEAAA